MGSVMRALIKFVGIIFLLTMVFCAVYRLIKGDMPNINKHPLVEDFDMK